MGARGRCAPSNRKSIDLLCITIFFLLCSQYVGLGLQTHTLFLLCFLLAFEFRASSQLPPGIPSPFPSPNVGTSVRDVCLPVELHTRPQMRCFDCANWDWLDGTDVGTLVSVVVVLGQHVDRSRCGQSGRSLTGSYAGKYC